MQSNFYRYDANGNALGLSWAGCKAAQAAKLATVLGPYGHHVAVDESGEEVDLASLPKRAPTKSQVETLRQLLSGVKVDINSNSLNSLLAKDLVRPVSRRSTCGRFSNIEFEVTAHGCAACNKASVRGVY